MGYCAGFTATRSPAEIELALTQFGAPATFEGG
jgi:hypothetical protein